MRVEFDFKLPKYKTFTFCLFVCLFVVVVVAAAALDNFEFLTLLISGWGKG